MNKKNIAIFGSTGSIGKMALSIAKNYKEFFNVSAISAGSNIDLLSEQIKEFHPKYVSISNQEKYQLYLLPYNNLHNKSISGSIISACFTFMKKEIKLSGFRI